MFKRLERRLLLSNLVVLSVLLLIVFGSLFGSIYSSVQKRINDELYRITVFNTFDLQDPFPQRPPNDGFELERTVSFLIRVDTDGNIVETTSQFTAEDAFFIEAYSYSNNDSGRFEMDNYQWAYLITDFDDGQIIAFMDITSEMDVLRTTIINYSIIFVGAFLVVSLISYFLTRQSVKPIKESMRKQQQFIADASHELKTPLTVINTNLDVIKAKDDNPQKWLNYIQNEVERMNLLTQKLLYLASVTEMEHDAVVTHEFNGSELIQIMLLELDALAYDKRLEITHELNENVQIHFNKEQFRQVMMILLDNAIKYTHPKGRIHVLLEEKSNHINISVTNTGDGMTEEEQAQVFERFYKKDSSRSENTNSFGLGLAIAKQIIDNHHGKLVVSSEKGESTTFTIRLKK